MTAIYLDIIGRYGDKGWQDPDTSQEFFNDCVRCEYGMLGKLKSEIEIDFPIIIQADELVLIRRDFPTAWNGPITGASIHDNPFGFQVFELVGKNGMVRYRLFNDELKWRDPKKDDTDFDPEKLARFQLGQRTYSKWEPIRDPEPSHYSETTTTVIQEAS